MKRRIRVAAFPLAAAATLFASCVLMSCAGNPGPQTGDSQDTDTDTDTVADCPDLPRIDWLSEPGADPLVDGDTVTMVHGPQGGWHIGLNAGIRGNRALVFHPYVERVLSGEQLAGDGNAYELVLADWDGEACTGRMIGMVAYLDDPEGVNQEVICGLVGQQLRLGLTATDPAAQETVEASVLVVAQADPTDDCG